MSQLVARAAGIVGMLYGLSAWASPLIIDIEPIGPFFSPDSVIVNGVEWAQLDIFNEISWNDINAVCPQLSDGRCNGSLENILLTGWTWASVNDVNRLFNHYLSAAGVSGSDLLEGPDFYLGEHLSQWARDFYDAGFRVTPGVVSLSQFIVGPLRDLDASGAPRIALLSDDQSFGRDSVRSDLATFSKDSEYPGGWFFRSSEVPVVSTLFLCLTGLLGLAVPGRNILRCSERSHI